MKLTEIKQAVTVLVSLVALAGCALPSASADGTPPVLAQMSQISGQGGPVVVLQSGLSDGMASWDRLAPLLAKEHTVFRYDRPGRQHNPAAQTPRDPCHIASEQRDLLRRAGLRPPYVLVGHSLGGLYQYTYARLFPDEVAALVLLDPTHPEHWRSLQVEHPHLARLMKGVRVTMFSQADRAEFDAQSACLSDLPASRTQPIPTTILASGRHRREELAMAPMLDRLRQDWLRLIEGARLQTVPDAGHYIHQERPQFVVDAVRSFTQAAGAQDRRITAPPPRRQ